MVEIWKDIENFEGMYQVSDMGRIRSLARTKVLSNGRKLTIREKILTGHIDTKGYLQVELRKDGKRNISCIHRLVASAFIENPERKEQVNHKDGNKRNNAVENLEWVTCEENIHHAWKHGLNTASKGQKHPNSILTDEQAKWIKEHYIPRDKKYGMSAMARMFGISTCPIYNIIHEKGWKHL